MSQRSARSRRGSNFNLGAEQAEADKQLLRAAFYESDDYLTISDKDDSRCFLIARTGSGKSAALQRLEEENPEHVVRVVPEDLSLQYITNLGVMKYLDNLDVSLDPLFIALWKHVLLVELIRQRYKVDSYVAKQNFLSTLREKIKRDPGKRAALDYLEEFQDRFWVEADQRVKEITEKFEEKINKEASGKIGFGKVDTTVGASSGDVFSSEVRTEFADRFQKIVNETQMARLNKMIRVLDEDILDSRQNFTYVVIDDLDRDWVDEGLSNSLIRCLFRAVLDLQRVQNLKIVVALRTNIFEHLDFGHRSGGQEEKFRSLVLRMRWTPGELEDLVGGRLRVASDKHGERINSIRDLLPRSNQTRGDAMDYMVSRTLLRPRDIIAFLNEALSTSSGSGRITWDEIRSAEETYSHKRLLALRDEWKTSYPQIDKIFYLFERATLPMRHSEFTRILDDAITLTGDPEFVGGGWLGTLTAKMWTHPSGSWIDWYGPLVSLMYNIGFIGCMTGSRSEFRYAQSYPDFAERSRNLESVTHFNVHPAFRLGLDARIDNSWR